MRGRQQLKGRRYGAVRAAVGLAVLVSLGVASSANADDVQLAPVPLRAISPLRLLFFQLTPEGAATLGKGERLLAIDVSESNVLHTRNFFDTEFDADINLEITRVNLRFRYGLSDRTDFGVELPVYRFHSGFLDSPIRGLEDALGDLKVQRVFEQEMPGAGLFRYFLKRNGSVFFELPRPTSGIGDLAVSVKRTMLLQSGRRPALSLRAALKLPTGDEDRAMGSGDIDLAIGLAGDYSWRRWSLHGNLNVTLPFAEPFAEVGLTTPWMLSGHLGVARRVSPTWVFHFQVASLSEPFERAKGREPSPLPSEPFEDIGGSIIDATLGASHTVSRRSEIWFALVEDFQNTNNAAADVTLLASFIVRAWS